MSIAAYPIQSALPDFSQFEPSGGQNNGSCFVLHGQSSGFPTILRPRVTPIQEASMSVSLTATVNTLNNNASNNGYEGLAPTFELLRVEAGSVRKLWDNGLMGAQRRDLWISEKRDWHKLTWIQAIPENMGADLLNVGLVNKCPSGYAKVSNISLTNHYAKHYATTITGSSTSIPLTQKLEQYAVTGRYTSIAGDTSTDRLYTSRSLDLAYLALMPVDIKRGEDVTQSVAAIIGATHAGGVDADMPMHVGITLKMRARDGAYVHKSFPELSSETPAIGNSQYIQSFTWTADDDYTQIEPLIHVRTRLAFGSLSRANTASHEGIRITISSKQNLTSSV